MTMEKRAELSPRLQGVAEMIPEGARLADVGTDHAYLPAWLLQNGRIPSAIASDVREGPLSRARATARACGCFERMSFRLCDGLSGIAPEEVDALVIAGMGGETIANILEAAPWVKEKDFPIILQPMSTQAELRGWLWRNGFLCLREKTVFEGETLYSIILARQGGAVPMTPAEIAEDVYACWKAGAAIAHLHMRDDEGHGTMDKEKFRKTVELLRANHPDCDIILNMTTSGDIHADDTTRQIHLKELRPEMGSYDCGSMNWLHTSLFLNPPAFLEELGKNMQEWGVKPEIEAFDPGMIANAAYYLKKGVLKAPLHFQFCMGCANGIPGSLKNLIFMKETMESLCPGSTWSCFGVGHCALEMLYGAVALGGHIRVGMEDNVMYAKGVLAESNVQFVERARRVIEEYGKQVATPAEAREILSLGK